MDLLTESILQHLYDVGFVTVLVPANQQRQFNSLIIEIQPVKRESCFLLETLVQFTNDKLSEPYSRYTFKHMVNHYKDLCFLVFDVTKSFSHIESDIPILLSSSSPLIDDFNLAASKILIGVAISTLEDKPHHSPPFYFPVPNDGSEHYFGYLAMVTVAPEFRGMGLGILLGDLSVKAMTNRGAVHVTLETEVTNTVALNLYDRLGFQRIRRMHRYYLSGLDAFALIKLVQPNR